MTLETSRFNVALARINSQDLSPDEKLTVANVEEQIKKSAESLTNHSMLVSTSFRFAAHMTAMREATADLHNMYHVAIDALSLNHKEHLTLTVGSCEIHLKEDRPSEDIKIMLESTNSIQKPVHAIKIIFQL